MAIALASGQIVSSWVQRGLPDVDIYAAIASEPAVGALIQRFTASNEESGVLFEWTVDPDHSIARFVIFSAGEEPGQVLSVEALPSKSEYDALALHSAAASGMRYTLRAILRDGTEVIGPEAVLEDHHPIQGGLISAAPNPFSRTTMITVRGEHRMPGGIRVLDLQGRLVRELKLGADGSESILWDGKDGDGVEVPDGIYFVQASSFVAAAKCKVVKLH
jgi:hypothetical protein